MEGISAERDAGRTVLIVEDEPLIAALAEDALLDAGFEVSGIAAHAHGALRLVHERRPDLVLLDVRLAGSRDGIELAGDLAPMGIGILFVTGNCREVRLRATHGEACLSKPYRPDDMIAALRIVDDMRRGLETTQAAPANFFPLTRLGTDKAT
jgi:DNA-binding response OmpR family regulator